MMQSVSPWCRPGCDDTQSHRQRYRRKACADHFGNLTGTVLAGHHRPLRIWEKQHKVRRYHPATLSSMVSCAPARFDDLALPDVVEYSLEI